MKLAPPATAELGFSKVIAGGGTLIVNVKAAEAPPPGAGFDTVTMAVPAELISAAVIAACKLLPETKVVARALPFHRTVDDDTKLVPVTVNVKPAPAAKAEFGFRDTTVGAGLSTVKVNVPEVPPPGVGLETVTMFVPPVAMSAAVIAACKVVLETKVVVRAPAFHCTIEEDTKFVPVTVSVNAAPLATTELGFKDAIVGAGLLIVKVNAAVAPPPGPGVEAVTIAVPPVEISAAVIAACKLVLETNVVVRAAPFHCTVEENTKLVPVTVSVNAAPPATVEFGPKDAIVGAGLLIVKINAAVVPPPGPGVETETCAVPAAAMSAAVMAACKVVLDTKVVVRAVPFHCTTDEDRKLAPVTVSVNAAPPTRVELGFKDPAVGTGLLVIVKVNVLVGPPPGAGVKTETCAVPGVAMSAAVMAACKLVLDTKVVVRALPFHLTIEGGLKPVPVTVSVKPGPPATAELGFRDPGASDGFGLAGGGVWLL